MLTKAKLRLIRSLENRKWRRESQLFVAEGPKLVGELASKVECHYLLFSQSWAEANEQQRQRLCMACGQPEEDVVSNGDFGRASLLQTPQGVLALFRIPTYTIDPIQAMTTRLNLVLDGVQDPGNLGTIVRLADWFGISDIWCSTDTADVWNPKAVQASMGGIARVRVHYLNISATLAQLPPSTPRYATALDGESLWTAPLQERGVIVMGNEGRGVSQEVGAYCDQRLLIPPYPPEHATTDSLNVGVATAIVLAEFRRRFS